MVKKKIKRLQELEQQRRDCLAVFIQKDSLLEGSYSELDVRCGRSGCHCEQKPAHRVARLGLREKGILKNKVVRIADRDEVKRLIENFKRHKQALKFLENIHHKEKKVLKTVIKAKNTGYR